MLDDASPRVYRTVLAREPVHNHAPWLESPVGKSPSTIGIGWTGLLAYIAYVARGRVAGRADCTACLQ